jgi:Fe-S oxidoreductase
LSTQVFTFGEFMRDRINEGFAVPTLEGRKALVHGHCHHKAVMTMDGENAVLAAMKLDTEHPEDGCCGMAGAFGFEAGKYDVSIAVGERVLLPRVRAVANATLVIANGFSCRQQIEQTTSRRALHLAEVMQLARHAAEIHLDGQRPELAARAVIPAGIT